MADAPPGSPQLSQVRSAGRPRWSGPDLFLFQERFLKAAVKSVVLEGGSDHCPRLEAGGQGEHVAIIVGTVLLLGGRRT